MQPQVKLRQILVSDIEECEQLLQRLHQGEGFGGLARQHSECSTSQQDGELGNLCPGQLPETVDMVAFGGQLGIQGPIQSHFGFHIIDVQSHSGLNVDEEPRPRNE